MAPRCQRSSFRKTLFLRKPDAVGRVTERSRLGAALVTHCEPCSITRDRNGRDGPVRYALTNGEDCEIATCLIGIATERSTPWLGLLRGVPTATTSKVKDVRKHHLAKMTSRRVHANISPAVRRASRGKYTRASEQRRWRRSWKFLLSLCAARWVSKAVTVKNTREASYDRLTTDFYQEFTSRC